MSNIPLKPIKDKLKEYYKGEVSLKACMEVREILENVLDIISYLGVLEFQEQNKNRQERNFPKTKRLDDSIFINLSTNLFKSVGNYKSSRLGNYPKSEVNNYLAKQEMS